MRAEVRTSMRRPWQRLQPPIAVVALAAAVVGCGLMPSDPGADPAAGPVAVGPVNEVGRGDTLGISWRYSVYESTMGTCTRLELDESQTNSSSCGGEVPPADMFEAISVTGVGTGTGMPTIIEGFVTDEVAAVDIETDDGVVPATVMTLEPIGRDGQAFLALVPADRQIGDAVAFDEQANELGRSEIALPRP